MQIIEAIEKPSEWCQTKELAMVATVQAGSQHQADTDLRPDTAIAVCLKFSALSMFYTSSIGVARSARFVAEVNWHSNSVGARRGISRNST